MRNHRLDSLRGIASLSVLVHHCFHSANASLVPQILNVPLASVADDDLVGRALLSIFAGGVAVNIFFILSGAVLMASLQREERFDLATMVRFAGRRVFRIYPALILMVVTFGLLSWLYPASNYSVPFTLRQIVESCLLLASSVNGAIWTLQSEMLMVPFILLVALGVSILGNIATILFLFWAVSCLFLGAPFAPVLLNVAIPSFALGMLIPTVIGKNDIAQLPVWTVFMALVALFVTRFLFPISDTGALMALLVLSFLIVATLFHSQAGSHPFDHPALTFLGRISYGLYLIHPVVLSMLLPLFTGTIGAEWIAEHYVIFGFGFAALVAAITVPLSALCEMYVERPFIRMGQTVFSRKATPPPVVPQASPAE